MLRTLLTLLSVSLLAALVASCGGPGPRDVEGATTTLSYMTSAHCGGCKKAIESSLYGLPGVAKADLNVESKVVTVTFNPSISSQEQVENAIRSAGSGYVIEPYDPNKPAPAKTEPAKTDSAAKGDKKDASATKPADKPHSSAAQPGGQTLYYQTDAHCQACKEAIEDKLLALQGVQGANLDLTTKIVRVDLAASQAPTLAVVEDAIRNAGLGYNITRQETGNMYLQTN